MTTEALPSPPVNAEAASAGRAGVTVRWCAATTFFAILTAVFAAYAVQALQLEWSTQAGRIGPGFFPRIIGVLGVVLGVAALLRSLVRPPEAAMRPGQDDEDDEADGEAGDGAGAGAAGSDTSRYVAPMLVMVLTFPVIAAVLVPLGAVLTSAMVLAVLLGYLNRGHRLANTVLTVVVPLVMYAGFDMLLNAGLPAGVLPLP